jgi:hypothetical protein
MEGDRPHVVQKFLGSGEATGVSAAIVVVPIPDGVTRELAEATLSVESVKSTLSSDKAGIQKFLEGQKTLVDSQPAVMFDTINEFSQGGVAQARYVRSFVFLQNSAYVTVLFNAEGADGSIADAKMRWAAYKPLFDAMAHNLVLPERWDVEGARGPAANGSPAKVVDGGRGTSMSGSSSFQIRFSEAFSSFVPSFFTLFVVWGLFRRRMGLRRGKLRLLGVAFGGWALSFVFVYIFGMKGTSEFFGGFGFLVVPFFFNAVSMFIASELPGGKEVSS